MLISSISLVSSQHYHYFQYPRITHKTTGCTGCCYLQTINTTLYVFLDCATSESGIRDLKIILEKIQGSRSWVTAESVGVSSLCWRHQFNRIACAFRIYCCQYACRVSFCSLLIFLVSLWRKCSFLPRFTTTTLLVADFPRRTTLSPKSSA